MAILLIDNYDSFTYNLVQYFEILGQEVMVYYNDALSVQDIKALSPSHIVLSPGPNSPLESGVSLAVIEAFYKSHPILGVCLGHQCLAHAFGATVTQAPNILHGKTSTLFHHQQGLFYNIPLAVQVARYHSLCVDIGTLSTDWQIDALSEEGVLMAMSHKRYPLYGVQFHPEAILTECGLVMCNNFLKLSAPTPVYN